MELLLIVEDEHGTAEMLQLILEGEGYRVAVAHNGNDAIRQLAGEKPKAILSDFMMPQMTGAELGKLVRANPLWADIPFIMISASSEGVVRQIFDGYDAFISKPYPARKLFKIVGHFVAAGRTPPPAERRAITANATLQKLLNGLKLGPT